MEKERTSWHVPVNRTFNDVLEKAVKRDGHSTKSEFIREAVRRKLENMGFNFNGDVPKTA